MSEDQSAVDAIARANEQAEEAARSRPEVAAQVLEAEEVQEESDAALERSIFGDGREFGEGATKIYSTEITVRGGTTFLLRELTRSELLVHTGYAKRLQAEVTRLEALSDGKREAAKAETPAEAEAILAEAAAKREEEGLRIADAVVDFNRRVVEAAVRDWSNPKWKKRVPCNKETRAQLTPSVAAEICDAILSKSRSGRSALDFSAR